MSKKIFYTFLMFAFLLSGCSVPISSRAVAPGPEITDQISISNPGFETAFLTLEFGAGHLSLAPGPADKLVSGTAAYNLADLKPLIVEEGQAVRIHQGEYKMNTWPNLEGVKNEWDLRLGAMPLDLTIKAGAYEGIFDFGGLSLLNLTVRDGAAEVEIDFSTPTLMRMNLFKYQTGASNVTLKNLANANFTNLSFEGGAGNYTFDFGGQLQREAALNLQAGMSNISLILPAGFAAQVTVNGGLSSVNVPSSWRRNGDTYSRAGEGPVLTVMIDLGAGNLNIQE